MHHIELVIFDLDGTLIDAYPAIIKSFNYTMRKLRYPTQNATAIRQAVGWGDENLLRPFIREKDLKRAISLYRQNHKLALIKHSRLFPEAKRLLSRLKNNGYKLAVASNRPTRFSWILIRHLKLKKYFDYVLCADKLKHIKPHPEILKKIMQRLHIKAKETLYIGDMAIDAEAGRGAKIKTIIVTTGSSTMAQIKKAKPYHIINKLSEISDFLLA